MPKRAKSTKRAKKTPIETAVETPVVETAIEATPAEPVTTETPGFEKQANGLPRGPVKILLDDGTWGYPTELQRAENRALKLRIAADQAEERVVFLRGKAGRAEEKAAVRQAERAARELKAAQDDPNRAEKLRAQALALLARAEAAEALAATSGTDVVPATPQPTTTMDEATAS